MGRMKKKQTPAQKKKKTQKKARKRALQAQEQATNDVEVAGRLFSKEGAATILKGIKDTVQKLQKHQGGIIVLFEWVAGALHIICDAWPKGYNKSGRSEGAGGSKDFPPRTWLSPSYVLSLVRNALQPGSTAISAVPGDSASSETQAEGVVSEDSQLADDEDTECETDVESDSEVPESTTQNIILDSPTEVIEDFVEQQPGVTLTPLSTIESDKEEPTLSTENDTFTLIAAETVEQDHAEQLSDTPLTPHEEVDSDSEVPRSPAQETSLVAAPEPEQVIVEQSYTSVTHHYHHIDYYGRISASLHEDDDIFDESLSTLGQEDSLPEQVNVELPDTTASPHNDSFVSDGNLSTSLRESDDNLNETLNALGQEDLSEQVIVEQPDTTVSHDDDTTDSDGKLSTSGNNIEDIFNETSITLGQEDSLPEQVNIEQPDTTAHPHNANFVSHVTLNISQIYVIFSEPSITLGQEDSLPKQVNIEQPNTTARPHDNFVSHVTLNTLSKEKEQKRKNFPVVMFDEMDRKDRLPGADEFDVQRFDNNPSFENNPLTAIDNSPEQLTMEPRKLFNTTGTPARDAIPQFTAPKRVQRDLGVRRLVLPPMASGIDTIFPFQAPMTQNTGYGSQGNFNGSQSAAQRGFALESHLNTLRIGDNIERLSSQAAANNMDAVSRQQIFGEQSGQQSSSPLFGQFGSTTPGTTSGLFSNYTALEARSGNLPRSGSELDISPRTRANELQNQNVSQAANTENMSHTNSILSGSFSGVQKYATMQSLSKLPNETGDAMKQKLAKFSASEMHGRYSQTTETAQQMRQGLGLSMSGQGTSDNVGGSMSNKIGNEQLNNSTPFYLRRESSFGQGSQQNYFTAGQGLGYPPGYPQPLAAGPPRKRPPPIGTGRLGSYTSIGGSTSNWASTPNTSGQQPAVYRCEDDPSSLWYGSAHASRNFRTTAIYTADNSERIHETATPDEMKMYYPNGFPQDMATNPIISLPAHEKARMLGVGSNSTGYSEIRNVDEHDTNWHINAIKLNDMLRDSVPDSPGKGTKVPGPIQRPASAWLNERPTLRAEDVQKMSDQEVQKKFETLVTRMFLDSSIEKRIIAFGQKILQMDSRAILAEFGPEDGGWIVKAVGNGKMAQMTETFYKKVALGNNYVRAPKDAIDTSEDGNKSYFMDPAKLYPKSALTTDDKGKGKEKEKAKPSPLSQEWRATARPPLGMNSVVRPAASSSSAPSSSGPSTSSRGLGRMDSKGKSSGRR